MGDSEKNLPVNRQAKQNFLKFMTRPQSTKYRFDKSLSTNELAQAWIAVNNRTGAKCFVKLPVKDGSLGLSDINAILANSFNSQKKIKSLKIVTAAEKYLENGNLLVSYPYLDDKIWQPLTPDLFWRHFDQAIVQIAVIVDYLHLLDLVHCDLKLSNFLISLAGTTPKLILIDLDFLNVVDASPKGKLFGSPDHIAPEILANERIYTQSDSYSMGVTLGKLVEYYSQRSAEQDPGMEAVAKQLGALSGALTHEDPWHRPRVLVDALLEHKLIDQPAFEAAQKTVLAMWLLGEYRLRKTGQGAYKPGFVISLLQESRVLGLSDELLGDFDKASGKSVPATFRVLKETIDKSTVERYGDYWRIIMSDDVLSRAYALLEKIAVDSGAADLLPSDEQHLSPAEQLVPRAENYRKAGQVEKSLLAYQAALKLSDGPDDESNSVLDDILKPLAQSAVQLHRNHSAYDYFQRLLSRQRMRADIDGEAVEGLISVASRLGLLKESQKYIEEFIDRAVRAGDLRLELELRLRDAWDKAAMGSNDEAENIVKSVLARSSDERLSAVMIKAEYHYGVVMWRRAEFAEAEKHYIRSLELAEENDLRPAVVRAVIGLVLLYLDTAEYAKASKYFKLGIKNLVNIEDYHDLPLLASFISAIDARTGEHKKAEYWLQKSLVFTTIDSNHMLEFYIAAGLTRCAAGDFLAARRALEKGLELSNGNDMSLNAVCKVHYNMTELAAYQGLAEVCTYHLRRALEISEKIGDPASTAEVQFFGMLNDLYNGDGCDTETLVTQLATLVKYNCRYFASVCLFHTLVSGDHRLSGKALEIAQPLRDTIRSGDSPVFRALAILTEDTQSGAEMRLNIISLKSAYRILESAGQKFAALILCRKIAERYALEGKSKLARKFLSQALKIAESIDNKRLASEISEELDGLVDSSIEHSSVMESV
ncbi:MAG: hypothetical protein E4G91_08590, partial [Candidatus Zixiibacteriota bacterium]